jgi:nucleoside-diphosphate-sugar epimerase
MLTVMAKERGLRFVACRFGTIFGVSVGMRFHTAINKFCWQAVMEQPITVWRTAMHQVRPYLDLTDAVEALTLIMRSELYDGRVYNVVTTNSSVHSITEVISRYVPDISVELVDSEIMNQLSYEVSGRRFESVGFTSRGQLEQGIRETIELLSGANSCRS